MHTQGATCWQVGACLEHVAAREIAGEQLVSCSSEHDARLSVHSRSSAQQAATLVAMAQHRYLPGVCCATPVLWSGPCPVCYRCLRERLPYRGDCSCTTKCRHAPREHAIAACKTPWPRAAVPSSALLCRGVRHPTSSCFLQGQHLMQTGPLRTLLCTEHTLATSIAAAACRMPCMEAMPSL